MIFHSILTERLGTSKQESVPDFFVDLNLDQIIAAVVAGYEEYDLRSDFYTPLTDPDTILYRHEVMQDLEEAPLLEHIKRFAAEMHAMRQHLFTAEKLYYHYQKKAWFLDAVEAYCGAVETLVRDLHSADLRSRGFLAFREYLLDYVGSDRFTALAAQMRQLKADLAAVQYCLIIEDGSIRARSYDAETDYSAEIETVFDRFKQGAVKSYLVKFPASDEMNHIEAAVLEMVAKLHVDLFQRLNTLCSNHAGFADGIIQNFDREIQFYVSFQAYIAPLKRAGLPFCYPDVSSASKEVGVRDGFDLALASKLVREGTPIVRNDFHLQGRERIFIVSGPNQGGKTTFARAFGQILYLASLGCPVPGREARLFLFDRLFTHFEREEDITTLRGKLEDDLVRIHQILGEATSSSVIVMNEIFTSTALKDAIFLSRTVLEELVRLDLLCVWVTFIDELAAVNEKAVSLVSTIVPGDPASRTYRIVRKPAGGASYALAIAEKHRLTYAQLRERLAS